MWHSGGTLVANDAKKVVHFALYIPFRGPQRFFGGHGHPLETPLPQTFMKLKHETRHRRLNDMTCWAYTIFRLCGNSVPVNEKLNSYKVKDQGHRPEMRHIKRMDGRWNCRSSLLYAALRLRALQSVRPSVLPSVPFGVVTQERKVIEGLSLNLV